MKRISFVFILILVFANPSATFAASPWTKEKNYGNKVAGKFSYGLKNLALGWSELFTSYGRISEPDTNVAELTIEGIGYTLLSTIGGALQVVTFLAPFDIPLPHDGIRADQKNPLREMYVFERWPHYDN